MASLIYGTCTSPWTWIYIQAICADNGNSIYSKKENDGAEICWNNQWLYNNIKELNRFVSMSVRNELQLWQEIKVKEISLGKAPCKIKSISVTHSLQKLSLQRLKFMFVDSTPGTCHTIQKWSCHNHFFADGLIFHAVISIRWNSICISLYWYQPGEVFACMDAIIWDESVFCHEIFYAVIWQGLVMLPMY